MLEDRSSNLDHLQEENIQQQVQLEQYDKMKKELEAAKQALREHEVLLDQVCVAVPFRWQGEAAAPGTMVGHSFFPTVNRKAGGS